MSKLKIIFVSIILPSILMAQGSYDALKLSKTDIKGSARSMGMAGAFNALGGEAYSLSNNPGGLGVFSRAEVSTTMNLISSSTSFDQGKGFVKDQNNINFVFDNLTYVIDLDDSRGTGLNVGVGYNRLANFRKNYRGGHKQLNSGLPAYIANLTNGTHVDQFSIDYDDQYNENNLNWLSIIGYESFLFDLKPASNDQYQSFSSIKPENFLQISESGRVDEYAFSVGGRVRDLFYWGATLGVTDINYSIRSVYSENYYEDGNFDLHNDLVTKGTGLTAKFGVIIRPLDFIRLGVAIHTPTYYTLTDYFYGETVFNGIPYNGKHEDGNEDTPDDAEASYKLRTPLKVLGGLAFVLGKFGIISADYEFQDFRNARLRQLDGFSYEDNELIKSQHQAVHTIKVGAEVRPTPQLSLRIGYAYQTSPVKQSVLNGNEQVFTVGTLPHYSLDKGTQLITGGIGYRWSNFYVDAAVVSRINKQDIWGFSPYLSENGTSSLGKDNKVSIKNNRIETLVSVGYRF